MSVIPNEGNPENGGGTEAKPDSSQGQGQLLEAKVAEHEKQLKEVLGQLRAFQSNKDSAAERALQLGNQNSAEIARLGRYLNKTEAEILEAQRQAVLDEVVDERLNRSLPGKAAGGTDPQPGVTVDLSDIDKKLGVEPNDPRITQLKITHKNDPAQYAISVAEFRLSQIQKEVPITPAEQPLPSGTVVSQQNRNPTAEALQKEYEAKRDAIAKKGLRPEARIEQLTNLKAEYRNKGLNLR